MTNNLFDSFIVNDKNNFAVTAVKETVKKLHYLDSIIFLFGPAGSGKTHLLKAAYEYCLSMPFVTMYTKASDLYQNVKEKNMEQYEGADLLLIDDLDELLSLPYESFSIAFDEILGLARMGKQIIITADREITKFDGIAEIQKEAYEKCSMNISMDR